VGILYLPVAEWQAQVNPALRQQAAILLIVYSILLTAGRLFRKPTVAAWIIVGLAALELIQFDRITVSDRKTVSKQELEERVGYNDETVDALRDIKAGDNGFFRLTKHRPSGPSPWPSLNDAMVFGYYGTSCYSSFNSVNYTNFLTAVDALPRQSETETRWAIGLLDDPILSLFAGEKYALVENPIPFQRALQYEFVKQYGRDYLFRNARFLPLGLSFNRYILDDIFLKLPPAEKAEVLLLAVVISNESDAEKLGLAPVILSDLEQEMRGASIADVTSARRKTGLELTSFHQTQIEGQVRLDQKSVLVVQTPFDRGWHALQDGKPAPVLKVDAGLLGVALEAGEHQVKLHYRNPYLVVGAVISLVSFLILTGIWWRWPRLRLPA
jgi:uncharacterized membrane protein YfhO